MNRCRFWLIALVALVTLPVRAQSPPPYQTDFPPEEFQARWNAVFDRIGDHAIALVQGAGKARGFNLPRQTNEFYHLCGIETPHAYLVLDGRDRKVTLLLPPRDARLESAEGKVLSADDAEQVKRLTGVAAVASTQGMTEDWLKQLLGGTETASLHAVFPGRRQHRVPGRAQERRRGDQGRPVGWAAIARGQSGGTAADAVPQKRGQEPDTDPRRDSGGQESARDRPDPARIAARGREA